MLNFREIQISNKEFIIILTTIIISLVILLIINWDNLYFNSYKLKYDKFLSKINKRDDETLYNYSINNNKTEFMKQKSSILFSFLKNNIKIDENKNKSFNNKFYYPDIL